MLLQYLYWLRNHNSVLLHKKLLYAFSDIVTSLCDSLN